MCDIENSLRADLDGQVRQTKRLELELQSERHTVATQRALLLAAEATQRELRRIIAGMEGDNGDAIAARERVNLWLPPRAQAAVDELKRAWIAHAAPIDAEFEPDYVGLAHLDYR